jgi:hypothetical protein
MSSDLSRAGQRRENIYSILTQPNWDGIRDFDRIEKMINDGEFSLAALQRLNTIMLNVQEKGKAYETITDLTAGWSKAELWNTRAAMFAIFENGPLQREIDRVIAHHGRSDRKPYPRRARKFSVFPDELPGPWQAAFSDMDAGYPGENGTVPSPAMILTMKTKACEFVKAARDADVAEELSIPAAIAYERSLVKREKPLSARTVLSAIRQIRDLGRYIGADHEVLAHLASRIRIHESRSQGAIPQKEAKIQTLPDYSEIFGMALDMLGRADKVRNARSAQRLRNMAVAITLFSPFPLRAADTQLRFGDQILWDGGEYRFDLVISKTQRRFVAPVIPIFGWFIDQLVLQGRGPEHLADFRAECFQQNRPLFVNYDDSAGHERMVSYYWSEALGTGCHAARTHLHDAFGRFGSRGVELAMRACGQRSERTAEAYRTRAFEMLTRERAHSDMAGAIMDAEFQEFFGDGT